jgi:L-lactate dehydrogenase complex protein LldG
MNPRDEILARVWRQQPDARRLPELPAVMSPEVPAAGTFESFAAALGRMGGQVIEPPPDGDLQRLVAQRFPAAKVICSATPEFAGTRPLAAVKHPRELDDVDVGIVRAALGVAETGSVLLTETELQVEAIGFLVQHLVVLLDPARIVATLHDGYRDPAFTGSGYQIFMTGPSATADIEGVLIHGAQGIRSLTVVPLAVR